MNEDLYSKIAHKHNAEMTGNARNNRNTLINMSAQHTTYKSSYVKWTENSLEIQNT